ncbi:hypothetical protein GQ43DRAFT_432074 [Delitschia confertaspora ATCC 74209]|uniref:Uncharacterized protein n=1 Tax=Delitschia confertaspora ATCC 74209 TaxID=1513339 RepID=A0A9P4JQV9_9PLEO|nr:hypothetical protein GQ43DRAFT_432074 [Delitschia confertaspora ATCC 74209]
MPLRGTLRPSNRNSVAIVSVAVISSGRIENMGEPQQQSQHSMIQQVPAAQQLNQSPAVPERHLPDGHPRGERAPLPLPPPPGGPLIRRKTGDATMSREPRPTNARGEPSYVERGNDRETYDDDNAPKSSMPGSYPPKNDHSHLPIAGRREKDRSRGYGYEREDKDRSGDFGYEQEQRSHGGNEWAGGGVRKSLKSWWDKKESRSEDRDQFGYESKEQRYRRQREEWKAAYASLEQDSRHREDIIRNLQVELEKALKDNERTKSSANQMQQAMDNKELFLGPQATDDDIRIRFGSLNSSIKTWSSNFLSESSTMPIFREDLLSSYLDIVPLCREVRHIENLVSERKVRRLFVRGWAAYVISNLVFRALPAESQNGETHQGSAGADLWLGESERNSLLTLENRLFHADPRSIPPKSFNDWRALTTTLLSKTSSTNLPTMSTAQITAAAQDVLSLVSVWAPSDRHKDLLDSLIGIFTEAILLSQLLRRQRALWYVRFPRRAVQLIQGMEQPGPQGHLMFDPDAMKDEWCEDEGQDSGFLRRQYVEVVVGPGLWKRGNGDGEMYHVESCAVKASVLMRAPVGHP